MFLQPLNKESKCANGAFYGCSIQISNLIWDHILLDSQDLSASRTHPMVAKPILLTNFIHNLVRNLWTEKIRIGSKLQGSIGFKEFCIFEASFNTLSHHLTHYYETKPCAPRYITRRFPSASDQKWVKVMQLLRGPEWQHTTRKFKS